MNENSDLAYDYTMLYKENLISIIYINAENRQWWSLVSAENRQQK